jgi:hypothetical protein
MGIALYNFFPGVVDLKYVIIGWNKEHDNLTSKDSRWERGICDAREMT